MKHYSAQSLFLTFLLFASVLAPSQRACALDRDVKAVIITSLYGAVAGTVLGAASYPFTQSVRGIFMGTSLGLYLGAGAGLYHVNHRDDPENPLNPNSNSRVEPLSEPTERERYERDYRESDIPFGQPQNQGDGQWREYKPGSQLQLPRARDGSPPLVYIQVPVFMF